MRTATAEKLHARGVGEINAGRLARAGELLGRAAARTDDVDLLARIAASTAYVEAETGDRDAALERCTRMLALPGLTTATRGRLRGQRGLLLMLTGDLPGAERDLGSAIASGAEVDVVGRSLLNRGNLYLQQDDPAAAEADLAAATVALLEADQPVEAAMARHNLGYAHFLAGDLPDALREMDAARVVLAPLSAVSEATCDQDRAEVLMAAGLGAEGRRALDGAGRAYGSRRLRRRQAEAELALARHQLLADPAAARRTARQAARHFQTAGADAWRVRADAVALSAEIELGGASSGLVERAAELAEQLREQGLGPAGTTVDLHAVRVLLRRGRVAEARDRLRRLRITRSTPLDVVLLSREVRAEAAVRALRRTDALHHLRAGLGQVHEWQSGFASLDLQTLVAGRGRRLGVRGLALAVGAADDRILLEWSERARMLASRVHRVRAPHDAALLSDLTQLRELAAAAAGGGVESVGVSGGAVEGRGGGASEAALRSRIREQAWQARGSGQVADPCTLEELRHGLAVRPEPTALVAYVVTAEQVVALVVTAEGATRRDLGDRRALDRLLGGLLPDLDMAAGELPTTLATAVRAELADRVARLADLLVAPLAAELGAPGERRVVLTPSSVLAGVPWTLLPGLVGRPVVLAQSATSWLAGEEPGLRHASAGFVAGPRVARAEAEVAASAARWPGARCLSGESANAEAVSRLAASVDVLHVAAHGRHSAENPMFSGLQLLDGPWFGYDIDRLSRVPDVVILSACEVGRSSVRAGEELIGMTTAWLHAGVRCVLAAPAAVNDEAAYDLLPRVHERLAAGDDPPAAVAACVGPVGPDAPPAPFVCFV